MGSGYGGGIATQLNNLMIELKIGKLKWMFRQFPMPNSIILDNPIKFNDDYTSVN